MSSGLAVFGRIYRHLNTSESSEHAAAALGMLHPAGETTPAAPVSSDARQPNPAMIQPTRRNRK